MSRHTASLASEPAVAITRAPAALATWIAAVPPPPPPAGRRGLDIARQLGSRDEGQLRLDLIGAAELEQVEKVNRRGPHADPDQVVAHWRRIDILEVKFVGRSQLTDDPRFWHCAGSYPHVARHARSVRGRKRNRLAPMATVRPA